MQQLVNLFKKIGSEEFEEAYCEVYGGTYVCFNKIKPHRHCLICGWENTDAYDNRYCPVCEQRFEHDMEDGVYPRRLNAHAKEYFNDFQWHLLRLIEAEHKRGCLSLTEATECTKKCIEFFNQRAEEIKHVKPFDTNYRDDYLS